MKNVDEISISSIHEMIKNKEISIVELVQEYLKRIALVDQGPNGLNSILEINPDVLFIAKELDARRTEYTSKLYGVPILLKDNLDTADRMHTSAGSLALSESFASADSDIAKNLRIKGAVLLGKTNMTEFANHMTKGMKAGYSSRGGEVRSPYNKNKSPSGSSTGSAVAVSANLCAASIGTDTSGSIISPAVTNGIVGFRPSIGALSQKGIIPVSFTMDAAGPMTRTVMDSAILFSELTHTFIEMNEGSLKGTVIGINQSSLQNMTHEEEKKARTVIENLKKAGAILKKVTIPQIPRKELKQIQLYEFKYSLNKYLSNLPSSFRICSLKDIIAFNDLHPNQTLKYGQTLLIDAEENTRGDLSEITYKQLLQRREKTKKEMVKLLQGLDICIMFEQNLILQYVGLPIITIPQGLYNNGMPKGIYLTALNDAILLKRAYQVEQLIGRRVPPKIAFTE
ncbi:MAG: amidase [Clostridia bacterium]|nr:amidase [Clostridia bacterium]